MSLDAQVYCDCHERGRLRAPPPHPIAIFVEPNGDLGFGPYEYPFEIVLEWDRWRESGACEHPGGRLIHRRLGNISLIALLRGELQREADRFPILLTKVIYNGTHGGDYLAGELVSSLKTEVDELARFHCRTRETAKFMADFRIQMEEIIAAALTIQKPIAF